MILSMSRREVITAHADDSVRDVVARMEYYNVGCVVVVHNEKPAGIITDRDLALRLLGAKSNGKSASEATADEVMTRAPRTIREDEGFDKALALMRAAGARRLPVVDARGRLRGLVTLDDIIETLSRNLGEVAGLLERQRKTPKHSTPSKPMEEFAIRG